MGIVRTDKWLLKEGTIPEEMCERLVKHFPSGDGSHIYSHLIANGMYKKQHVTTQFLEKWSRTIPWAKLTNLYHHLKTDWHGPEIPIYTFPVDRTNRHIQAKLRGKSGLSFKDKLFLFLPNNPEWNEIKALLTHEYNHTCRLFHLKQNEFDCTFLDVCLMEGLAESAVKEKVGDQSISDWARYYNKKQAVSFYHRYVKQNEQLMQNNRKFHKLLYGRSLFPEMLGYSVGFHIVQDYLEANKEQKIQQLLRMKSETIMKGARSFHRDAP